MKVAMYLRKSRSDEELERDGQFNTLSRHRDTLIKLADSKNLSIISIHEEIVSGESLNQRPEMLKLLDEIRNGLYDAVLVMDMDRLGRGNMQEQGLILDAFKESKTKIITPRKTYDLNDEFDEEYSEFEAFMARKELKIITRRMQRGRIKSIEEGNYIGTYAPYGYKIEGYGRNRKLVIDPVGSEAIKIIFEMYSLGYGGTKIANRLNTLGYKASGDNNFYAHTIINIIKNPVYTGKVTWNKKSHKKGNLQKRRTVSLNPKNEWLICEGKHEAIISDELFELCSMQLKRKSHPPTKKTLTNPLAGIVFCGACGASMHYRPYLKSEPYIMCPKCNKYVSSKFRLVEYDLLSLLDKLAKEYAMKLNITDDNPNDNTCNETIIEDLKKNIDKIELQRSKLHDLLEQGIYDVDTFLKRQEILENKKNDLQNKLDNTIQEIKPNDLDISYNIQTVLEAYHTSDNIEQKNQLLKSVISKVIYVREKGTKPDEFQLEIELYL